MQTSSTSRRATVQASLVLTLCDSGDLPTSDPVLIADGNYSSLNAPAGQGHCLHLSGTAGTEGLCRRKLHFFLRLYSHGRAKPVIDYLNRLIVHNLHEKILLRGVTGSGKTEVFLQAIDTCIQRGKQAIMLVLEISLTPQMVERFVSRFRHPLWP